MTAPDTRSSRTLVAMGLIALIVLIADLTVKRVVTSALGPDGERHAWWLVEDIVGLEYVRNSGAAFGIAFTAFALAESVGGSGFLAAFAAGLVIVVQDLELRVMSDDLWLWPVRSAPVVVDGPRMEFQLRRRLVEQRQGEWIACVEEVALNRGLITAEQCRRLGDEMAGTDYGAYVTEVAARHRPVPASRTA